MLRRVQEAMADVKETLRRAFQGVAVRQGNLLGRPAAPGAVALDLTACPVGWTPLASTPREGGWRLAALGRGEGFTFEARLKQEAGWASWAAGASLVPVPLFSPGAAGRWEVPALPRRAPTRHLEAERFQIRIRQHRDPLTSPKTRRAEAAFPRPVVRTSLDHALRRPVSVEARSLASFPRPAQMRITLQLVKGTGENIRDLEVIGLFSVPRKGVRQMRVDPRNGRLLVSLSAEAVGAPQGMMVMARRRADQAVLSCFVEP
jgi:hypothetical protein